MTGLFFLFSFFSHNYTEQVRADFSRHQTWIIGVEGEHADHLMTKRVAFLFITPCLFNPSLTCWSCTALWLSLISCFGTSEQKKTVKRDYNQQQLPSRESTENIKILPGAKIFLPGARIAFLVDQHNNGNWNQLVAVS